MEAKINHYLTYLLSKDKSLKVEEDEWRERERGEQNFEKEKRENEV